MTKLMAFDGEDPRIRASIYATARLAFEAWTEPSVAHSASLDPRAGYSSDEIWDRAPRYVDLDWLMDGPPGRSNTLYLTAPATEFARLAPVLGGSAGRSARADPRLGHRRTPTVEAVADRDRRSGPARAAVAARGGVDDRRAGRHVRHRPGSHGHRSTTATAAWPTPCWAGTARRSSSTAPTTLPPWTTCHGSPVTEHVAQRGWSADTSGGRKTVSEHPQREDLLPAHVIRQMRRQEAVLLHGTLPPIHLRMVRWWEDQQLSAARAHQARRQARAPPDDGTCPFVDGRSTSPSPVLEPTVISESVGHLPQPRPRRFDPPASPPSPRSTRRPGREGQPQLDLAAARRRQPARRRRGPEPGRRAVRAVRRPGRRRGLGPCPCSVPAAWSRCHPACPPGHQATRDTGVGRSP